MTSSASSDPIAMQQQSPPEAGDSPTSPDAGVACACSNITIMQLFHELKAQYPAVPDTVVSQCIADHYHDREACRALLSAEQARLPRGQPYPPGLMGVAPRPVAPPRPAAPPTACSCGTTTLHKLQSTLPAAAHNCANNVNKILIETKDNLLKVPPSAKPMRSAKLQLGISHRKLTRVVNNVAASAVRAKADAASVANSDNNSASTDVDKNENLPTLTNNNNTNNKLHKKEKSSSTTKGDSLRKKFVKKSLNKVGKLADRITKRSDSAKSEPPKISLTHPPPTKSKFKTDMTDNLSFDLNAGSVGFQVRRDPYTVDMPSYNSRNPDSGFVEESLLTVDTPIRRLSLESHKPLAASDTPAPLVDGPTLKSKSHSMESVLQNRPSTCGDVAVATILTAEHALAQPTFPALHTKFGSDRTLDRPIRTEPQTLSEPPTQTPFSLTKSSRMNFDKVRIKPPIPTKPTRKPVTNGTIGIDERDTPPLRPRRLSKSPNLPVKHLGGTSTVLRPAPPPPSQTPCEGVSESPSEDTSIPVITNQKPPLPKRPSTLDLRPEVLPNNVVAVRPPENGTVAFGNPGGMNVSLKVNVDVMPTASIPTRRTILNVNPELAWLGGSESPRSFTSVNLTLRTPTSEPQAPIDIRSANSALTYSTSSFDPRKGFQSSVQITVSPVGGTASAMRMRPRSSYLPENDQTPVTLTPRAGSLPDLATKDVRLIQRQLERKDRLRIELIAERGKLVTMQREVKILEITPKVSAAKIVADEERLQREIRHLLLQCKQLTEEVDRHSHSRVPLGETNAEFYQNIYTGQRGPLRATTTASDLMEGGRSWKCHMCTFMNHPLLDKCEQCEMPRIVLGTSNDSGVSTGKSVSSPSNPFVFPSPCDYRSDHHNSSFS